MKKIFNLLIAATLMTFMATSCLKSNFAHLDTFEGNEITGVSGVFYRYYGSSDDIISFNGELRVYQAPLYFTNFERDVDKGTCKFAAQVLKAYFPPKYESEIDKAHSAKNLVVQLDISTAAIIKPLEGSAILGVPADWSKPNKYKVIAANGDEKIWTVELEMLDTQ